MAGAAGRKFPLDGAFALLRAEVEQTQAAFVELRANVEKIATAASKASTTGSPRAGGSGSGGSSSAAQTAANTQAIRDLIKVRDLMQSVSDLKAGIEGGRDLAKALGFQDASRHLDRFAKGLDVADKGVKGITGAVKLLGAAWQPVVTAVGAVSVGLLGVQRVFELATGTSLTLKETVQVMGLSLAKAFADAYVQVTRLRLAFASEESTPGLVRQLEDARGNAQALQDTIAEIRAQADVRGAPPEFKSLGDEFERAKTQYRQLVTDIGDSLGGVFGGLGDAGERVQKVAEAFAQAQNAVRGIKQELLGLQLQEAQTGFARASIMTEQLEATREQRRLALESVIKGLEAAKKEAGSAEDRLKIEKEIKRVREEGTDAIEKLERAEARSIYRRAQDLGSAGLQAGREYASGVLDAFNNAAPQLNEQLIQALTVDPDDESRIINSFSDLLENIKNLFRRNPIGFVAGILGLGGGGAFAGAGGGPGFATGGQVPHGRFAPSLAHLAGSVQGLAAGGFPRPAGIAASDTVPAWLTPGEFVAPVRAVMHYGAGLFEQLRTLSIPREPLMALAGEVSVPRRVSTPLPQGYASGGQVAGGVGAGNMAPTILPVMVTDPQGMERLMAGGESAMLQQMSRNPSAFRAALGL